MSEVRLEQVMARLTARTADGRWRFWTSVNAEGATMGDGVLNVGAFGEGYADRRHPHTWVHELAVGGVWSVGAADVSLTVGKGFVGFGTDDPMVRPGFKYPVNHHWAQIVERWVALGAVRAGPFTIEGTIFNGDEPERPDQWPAMDRFGDSWAVRTFLRPAAGVELQGSHAFVTSPEHRGGAGPDAVKWSASASLRRGSVMGMVEWARTTEADRAFTSLLGEMEARLGPARPYLRIERTSRPEEERRLDRFETVRPHLDDHVLGITRWTVFTVGYGHRIAIRGVTLEPLAEVTLAHVRELTGGLFDPVQFYGDDVLRQVSVGVRVHWGTAGMMGRYGVREPASGGGHHH